MKRLLILSVATSAQSLIERKLHGVRQDSPPKMVAIDYEIVVETGESDRRLELFHTNVRKYGTISNTVDEATKLEGSIRCKAKPAS